MNTLQNNRNKWFQKFICRISSYREKTFIILTYSFTKLMVPWHLRVNNFGFLCKYTCTYFFIFESGRRQVKTQSIIESFCVVKRTKNKNCPKTVLSAQIILSRLHTHNSKVFPGYFPKVPCRPRMKNPKIQGFSGVPGGMQTLLKRVAYTAVSQNALYTFEEHREPSKIDLL